MVAVGRFELIERLGATSTGETFLARDPDLGRLVLVKRLSPHLASDAHARQRFRTEARQMALIRSPHCVRVFDYIEAGGGAWVVSELVEGTTLGRLLGRQGRLGPEQSLGCLRGALDGLADIHRSGLVHRDIRPETIVIARDGTSKLADVGQMTVAGARMAAPTESAAYMAPELARGEPGDGRGDIYSMGCVLFECFEGRPPFVAPTAGGLLRQHLEAPPPNPGHAPERLRVLALACMAKNPGARPASADEVAAELELGAEEAYGPGWRERAALAGLLGLTGFAAGTVVPGLLDAGHATGASTAANISMGNAVTPASSPPQATTASAGQSPGTGPSASPAGRRPRSGVPGRAPLGTRQKLVAAAGGLAVVALAAVLLVVLVHRGGGGGGSSSTSAAGSAGNAQASTSSGVSAGAVTVDSAWRINDYATGFASDLSYGGPRGLVFDQSGRLLVADVESDGLYIVPKGGGPAESAVLVPAAKIFGLTATRSGRIYGTRAAHSDIVELSSDDGHVLRTVVGDLPSNLAAIAADPTMDAFYVSSDAGITEISDAESGTPRVTLLVAGGFDGITVAPDGTVYVVTYQQHPDQVKRIGHSVIASARSDATHAALRDADVQTVGDVPHADGTALIGDPSNPSVVVNTTDGNLVQLTPTASGAPTVTSLMSGGTRGDFVAVGPDGCLYATQVSTVIKVTRSDGSCSFLATTPQPATSHIGLWILIIAPTLAFLALVLFVIRALVLRRAAQSTAVAYSFRPGELPGAGSPASETLPSPHPGGTDAGTSIDAPPPPQPPSSP